MSYNVAKQKFLQECRNFNIQIDEELTFGWVGAYQGRLPPGEDDEFNSVLPRMVKEGYLERFSGGYIRISGTVYLSPSLFLVSNPLKHPPNVQHQPLKNPQRHLGFAGVDFRETVVAVGLQDAHGE